LIRRVNVKAESLIRKLQLVVFLSVLNTVATMTMIGQAYSGEVVKAFVSGPEKVSLTGYMEPSIISVEGVVLDR
jgi:hypothetical protein